ncbi:hypothetical protein DTO166G4_9233 [Paecilomyces variotii]|nr:hypothetical protein DTO166G4_9233 [Paecilomyces variotii]KAJ9227689.1 hypothetical protein DTO166G5_9255 [Paecilomyces variotii]KAJ9232492.1 hypothetical protein DTO169E5_7437 [Paecilomyces variotii]KAJ9256427.1 hypothetical protein DTO195F2_5835 [Paecilomyces variotii]KAJ9366404.1 hypothetical protein DTO282E5_8918 [Paecilomyces variotii]
MSLQQIKNPTTFLYCPAVIDGGDHDGFCRFSPTPGLPNNVIAEALTKALSCHPPHNHPAPLGNPTLQHLRTDLREQQSLIAHHVTNKYAILYRLPVSTPAEFACYDLQFLLPSRTHRRLRRPALPSTLSLRRQRFAYSTTTPSDAAKVILNPRKDDDGNDLWMKISPRAAERIPAVRLREITDPSSSSISTTLQENPYHHLRITVTSGGCHGFQYMMSLEPASKIDKEEDTVFEAETPSEGEGNKGQAQVVMDTASLELLSGSTVDYTMELIGSQFKIVDNPRATSNCGCGTSFDVE